MFFIPVVIFIFRLTFISRHIAVTRCTIVSTRPGLFGTHRSESTHSGTIGALTLQQDKSMALILVAPNGEHIAWLMTTKDKEQIAELVSLLRTIVRIEEGTLPVQMLR